MYLFLVLPYYINWHYGKAFSDIQNIWKNFFNFLYSFFSIPTLFSSLLSPWQRMQETYSEHFSIEGTLGSLVVNVIMRIIGAIVRSVFIIIGIVSLVLCLVLGIAVVFIWFILPICIIYLLFQGFNLITS